MRRWLNYLGVVLVSAIVLVSLSFIAPTVSYAECPREDMVEILIPTGNPGKTVTRCVSVNASENILMHNDQILPPCPCDTSILPTLGWNDGVLAIEVCENEDTNSIDRYAHYAIGDEWVFTTTGSYWKWLDNSGSCAIAEFRGEDNIEYFEEIPLSSPLVALACAVEFSAFAFSREISDCEVIPDFDPPE